MSKIFLAMRGTTAPFKLSKQKGAHPPSGNFWMGDGAEKVVTFFNNISQTKNSVWGLNRAFFHCLRPQRWGDKKPSKPAYIREKVK
jgi:hypothetical protein